MKFFNVEGKAECDKKQTRRCGVQPVLMLSVLKLELEVNEVEYGLTVLESYTVMNFICSIAVLVLQFSRHLIFFLRISVDRKFVALSVQDWLKAWREILKLSVLNCDVFLVALHS